MKIHMWVASLGIGGAERVFAQLASLFAASGQEVTLFTDSADNPYAAELHPGVRLDVLSGPLGWPGRIRVMTRHLRRERPAVLFTTGYKHNLAAIVAGRLAGVPVVVRESSTSSRQAALRKSLKLHLAFMASKLLYPLAAAIVAPSQGSGDDLKTHMPRAKDKIYVISNPVDAADIKAQAAAPLSPNAPQAFIMGAGRLDAYKGFDTLIRAWAKLRRSHPLDLVILGEGPERGNLENLARELRVQEHLLLPGFDANPYRWMARARAFVLSSRYEGLPNVLLQAMACGTPVVAADCVSGPREILEGGKFGALVPVDDVPGFVKALEAAVGHPADPSAAESLKRYDPQAVAQAWLSVFSGL